MNINSLPMVVDMTDATRIGTYMGLYYLFSTLSAIAGPNVNGWIIQFTGNNYNSIMFPVFDEVIYKSRRWNSINHIMIDQCFY